MIGEQQADASQTQYPEAEEASRVLPSQDGWHHQPQCLRGGQQRHLDGHDLQRPVVAAEIPCTRRLWLVGGQLRSLQGTPHSPGDNPQAYAE